MDSRRRSAWEGHRPAERRYGSRQSPEQHPTPERREDQAYIQSWLTGVGKDNDGRGNPLEGPQWRSHSVAVPEKRRLHEKMSPRRRYSYIPRDNPLPAPSGHQHDRRSLYGASTVPPSSLSGKENRYAKRARRKTREDRYETKKRKSVAKNGEAAQKPSKRKDRKQELKSGKEVMHNFISNAVSNDRVTIKPKFTAGLFSNARIPNSVHVTDLTFNDMEFLARQDHRKTHERNPKSREKDQRKISKDLQEEADFFDQRNPRRDRLGQVRDFSPIPRHKGDKSSDESRRPRKLQGAELQRLKMSLNTARPPSAPLEAPETPSLPSLPRASRSDTTYVSWSTSPASVRRRREPAESAKGPSTTNSPVAPSAIRRLIQTGVFDFANRSERSGQASRSEVCEDKASHASPEQPQYEDKGVMNSPWSKHPREEGVAPEEPNEYRVTTGQSLRRPVISHAQRGENSNASTGLLTAAPLLQLNGMAEDEYTPTFHQLQSTAAQNLQTPIMGFGHLSHWVGPRLPQILPSLAEISQEISDAQQLGQYWSRDSLQYSGDSHEGRTHQHQLPPGTGHLHGAHTGGETMAAFIARLEAEVLGGHPEAYRPYEVQKNERYNEMYSQGDDTDYPRQFTGSADNSVQTKGQGQGPATAESYDETEMIAFWRPNRFL